MFVKYCRKGWSSTQPLDSNTQYHNMNEIQDSCNSFCTLLNVDWIGAKEYL